MREDLGFREGEGRKGREMKRGIEGTKEKGREEGEGGKGRGGKGGGK